MAAPIPAAATSPASPPQTPAPRSMPRGRAPGSAYLVSKFGTAANGGVAVYDLDNEPSWWDAVHRDVHPAPFTYDEVTNNGIAHAAAIKAADPTAEVSGPVIDFWWAYFYSKKDIEIGWGSGVPAMHRGAIPSIATPTAASLSSSTTCSNSLRIEKAHGTRLLDYVDLHTYFAPDNLAFSTGGDTQTQEIRLNSTRVFWDPTYTDPNFPQPNYTTDANYTSNCNTPLQAPQVIPMMKQWVANDYPGTKIAITEYNWGGQETHQRRPGPGRHSWHLRPRRPRHRHPLGTARSRQANPGLMAFEVFRNYDGAKSTFGDRGHHLHQRRSGQALRLRRAPHQGQHAHRRRHQQNLRRLHHHSKPRQLHRQWTGAGFLYSSANLNAIVAQPNITVTAPAGGSTTSTLGDDVPRAVHHRADRAKGLNHKNAITRRPARKGRPFQIFDRVKIGIKESTERPSLRCFVSVAGAEKDKPRLGQMQRVRCVNCPPAHCSVSKQLEGIAAVGIRWSRRSDLNR